MLLLVIDAELDQRRGVLRQIVVEQTLQRLVHMSAVGAHLGRGRARQQSTLGPRHPRPQRGLLTRPSAAQVRAYRAHVDEALERLFDNDLPEDAAALIELGINHEQQHQELLLTDILSLFAAEPLKPAYREAKPGVSVHTAAPLAFTAFDGGIFEVGHKGDGFAYDNEGPRHEELIRPSGSPIAASPTQSGSTSSRPAAMRRRRYG